MATIFSHIAIPLATGLGLGRSIISRRLMFAGMLVSIFPDFDTIGFKLGVVYASEFGHRGLTHSTLMAIVAGLCAILLCNVLQTSKIKAFIFVSLSMMSHGLLDMMTTGGLGVAIFWPFNDTRYFFDFRPIRVSPIGVQFFSERGLNALISELKTIWLTAMVWMAVLRVFVRNDLRVH